MELKGGEIMLNVQLRGDGNEEWPLDRATWFLFRANGQG